jgi:flagellar protein FlaG
MSADTFVSALFIITAVVAAGILINAVYPIVWTSASTFSSSAHETDTRMRTDFKIVTTFAQAGIWGVSTPKGDIYLKNIGSNPISYSDIENGDVFFGEQSKFTRLTYKATPSMNNEWTFEGYNGVEDSYDRNTNKNWDTGETLHIIAYPDDDLATGDIVYFQFILPNGALRDVKYTTT